MTNPSTVGRYDREVDLDLETSHTKMLRLIGTNQRVLDLGCATGQLAKVLRERGCDVVGIEPDPEAAKLAAEHCSAVIVGDVEDLDLSLELGERRFDVIVAGDVLEHLKQPELALAALRPFLDRNGCLITSVPNVGHGSVRLALLGGAFPYAELGLLDRTHLRFYTRESLLRMLGDADFTPIHVEGVDLPIELSEVPFAPEDTPPGVLEALAGQSDALVYQFVVVALPTRGALGAIPMLARALAKRVQELAPLKAEVDVLRPALEQQREAIEQMRVMVLEANDKALRNDGELERMRLYAAQLSAAAGQKDHQIAALENDVAQLRKVEQSLKDIYASKLWRIASTYRGVMNVLRASWSDPRAGGSSGRA